MKFKVVIIDDVKAIAIELVKKALGSILTTDETQKMALCDTFFEIDAFEDVMEAINFYTLNPDSVPDIFVIDIDFSENPPSNVLSSRWQTLGVEMLEFIKKKCPTTPYIVLSGNVEKVEEELKKRGIDTLQFDYARKTESKRLQGYFTNKLQERALYYFLELDEYQKGRLQNINSDQSDVQKILSQTLSFDNNKSFAIGELLIGFGQNWKIETLKKTIAELLNSSKYGTELVGDFGKHKKGKEILDLYLNSRVHAESKQEKNIEAFEVLLELLQIIEHSKKDASASFKVCKKQILDLSKSFENNATDSFKILDSKLVGRRIALAFEYLTLVDINTHFSIEHLVKILGFNDSAKETKSDYGKNIFNTKLGLGYEKYTILLAIPKILKEENEWLNNYAIHAKAVREFLYDEETRIVERITNLGGEQSKIPSFTTFTEYKGFIDNMPLSLRPAFLKELRDNLKNDCPNQFALINKLLGCRLE